MVPPRGIIDRRCYKTSDKTRRKYILQVTQLPSNILCSPTCFLTVVLLVSVGIFSIGVVFSTLSVPTLRQSLVSRLATITYRRVLTLALPPHRSPISCDAQLSGLVVVNACYPRVLLLLSSLISHFHHHLVGDVSTPPPPPYLSILVPTPTC